MIPPFLPVNEDKLEGLTIGQAILYSSQGYKTKRAAWEGMGNKLLLIEDWEATDWIAYKEE